VNHQAERTEDEGQAGSANQTQVSLLKHDVFHWVGWCIMTGR